jgi:hypothetical protein
MTLSISPGGMMKSGMVGCEVCRHARRVGRLAEGRRVGVRREGVGRLHLVALGTGPFRELEARFGITELLRRGGAGRQDQGNR